MSEAARVLVVEDEAAQRRLVAEILGREGYQVREAGTVAEALAAIDSELPDLVLCDWRMPGGDGGELLDEVRGRALACAFVVMTAYGSIAHAVEAIRRGADDYLGKPFERVDDDLMLVHRGGEGEFFHVGEGDGNMVWVTEDVEGGEDGRKIIIKKRVEGGGEGNFVFIGGGEHERRNVVVVKGKAGELDIEELKARFGDDFEESHTADGETVLKWVSEGDERHPMILESAGSDELVVYRCEETGSTLTVKKDEHLLDSYLDPVTGCVMKKMEGSGMRTYRFEVITEQETEE